MVKLRAIGMDRTFDGDPDMPRLWYVRDILGLTGTKFGCGIALCGACTVHKNGEAIRSCVTPMSAAAGSEIHTIEDLGANGLHPVQEAWMEMNVPQCGYCQSGQIMQALSFLKSNAHPADQEIDDAMADNIGRCGTPQRIRKVIKLAAGKAHGVNAGSAAPASKAEPSGPFHGYYFRMLNGHLKSAGFAVIAYRAEYRWSGVMTFVLTRDNVVYKKDLGPNTVKLAKKMTAGLPSSSWQAAE